MEFLIVIGLALINGVFAMSEVALLTARKSRLEALAKQGDRLAAAAVRLAQDPTKFLSTITCWTLCSRTEISMVRAGGGSMPARWCRRGHGRVEREFTPPDRTTR